MSYTTGGITYLGAAEHDGGTVVRASVAHTDKAIQLYVSGVLAAWAVPRGGTVAFELAVLQPTDVLHLLAVDFDEAGVDYFAAAFGASAEHGNRIRVRTPQWICGFAPGDRWVVYRSEEGEPSADILAHRQEFYPQGRRACGYGSVYGHAYGYDGADARGYGYNYGRGEYGFDCEMLEWVSEPLAPGDYALRVLVEDEHGNESQAVETVVALDTYPRAAADLAVESYDSQSDTLTLSWTGSEDLNDSG